MILILKLTVKCYTCSTLIYVNIFELTFSGFHQLYHTIFFICQHSFKYNDCQLLMTQSLHNILNNFNTWCYISSEMHKAFSCSFGKTFPILIIRFPNKKAFLNRQLLHVEQVRSNCKVLNIWRCQWKLIKMAVKCGYPIYLFIYFGPITSFRALIYLVFYFPQPTSLN